MSAERQRIVDVLHAADSTLSWMFYRDRKDWDESTVHQAIAVVRGLAAELSRARHEPSNGQTHWEGCWREHHACAVARIERELTTGTAIGWRTMESAPRDGARVLIYFGAGTAYPRPQMAVAEWLAFDHAPHGWYVDARIFGTDAERNVTAWQPLPSAPPAPLPTAKSFFKMDADERADAIRLHGGVPGIEEP